MGRLSLRLNAPVRGSPLAYDSSPAAASHTKFFVGTPHTLAESYRPLHSRLTDSLRFQVG